MTLRSGFLPHRGHPTSNTAPRRRRGARSIAHSSRRRAIQLTSLRCCPRTPAARDVRLGSSIMSSARKRERPEWLKDHDDGSWLDERGAGDNEGDGDDEYVGDSSASAPKAKAPRPSAPKPKPKPPAAPAATMTVTTKEERSLLA
eukprot:2616395-Prymnesium_polylepis.1